MVETKIIIEKAKKDLNAKNLKKIQNLLVKKNNKALKMIKNFLYDIACGKYQLKNKTAFQTYKNLSSQFLEKNYSAYTIFTLINFVKDRPYLIDTDKEVFISLFKKIQKINNFAAQDPDKLFSNDLVKNKVVKIKRNLTSLSYVLKTTEISDRTIDHFEFVNFKNYIKKNDNYYNHFFDDFKKKYEKLVYHISLYHLNTNEYVRFNIMRDIANISKEIEEIKFQADNSKIQEIFEHFRKKLNKDNTFEMLKTIYSHFKKANEVVMNEIKKDSDLYEIIPINNPRKIENINALYAFFENVFNALEK